MAKTLFESGDIETKLTQWGLWSRGDGMGAAALRKGDGVRPDITDEQGLAFDKLVLALKRCCSCSVYEVIVRHYQMGRGVAEIAHELRMCRATVYNKRNLGLVELERMLCESGFEAAA